MYLAINQSCGWATNMSSWCAKEDAGLGEMAYTHWAVNLNWTEHIQWDGAQGIQSMGLLNAKILGNNE